MSDFGAEKSDTFEVRGIPMLKLDQEKFMSDFVTTFLATKAANDYDAANADTQVMSVKKPPVMHAISLARIAWHTLMSTGMVRP